ncbi:hypothetical protein HK100_001553 [Physocladia obscura]|uniref:Uncharacterized protein n=1 Tax=Physocladia obscura TaxID=109957 RepID=A0AAD5SYA6_9FUNG|nr:hypothetical protein HK100_001553 [Physocladia obscura]
MSPSHTSMAFASASSTKAKKTNKIIQKDDINPEYLKGTELWPMSEEFNLGLKKDIGAGWVPIYITLVNSHIRSLFITAACYNDCDVVKFQQLERNLEQKERLNFAQNIESQLKDIQSKAHILKLISEIGISNRAVKNVFWKSLVSYKFLMDEIEFLFIIIKKFADAQLYPQSKRTQAQLAAQVGLEEQIRIKQPEVISQACVLFAIRYLRRCIQLLTMMLFDTEQVLSRANLFTLLSPYGFGDLVKILIAGSSLEALIRGPTIPALNQTKQHKLQFESIRAKTHGLTRLLDDLHILQQSSIASTHSDNASLASEISQTSIQVQPPPPPPSTWSSIPVRFMYGTKSRNRNTASAFASCADSNTNNAVSSATIFDLTTTTSTATISESGSRINISNSSLSVAGNQYNMNSNQVYTGDSGRRDLWNAKWHENTKSAFMLQKKIENVAQRQRKIQQNQIMEAMTSTIGGAQNKPKIQMKVKFDLLDATTLLSLPLPPLPPDRPPILDPWFENEGIDSENTEFTFQAANLHQSGHSIANLNVKNNRIGSK